MAARISDRFSDSVVAAEGRVSGGAVVHNRREATADVLHTHEGQKDEPAYGQTGEPAAVWNNNRLRLSYNKDTSLRRHKKMQQHTLC